jgi:hypothetical protein
VEETKTFKNVLRQHCLAGRIPQYKVHWFIIFLYYLSEVLVYIFSIVSVLFPCDCLTFYICLLL